MIPERYENGSVIVTRNRGPEEWPDLFGNVLLPSVGLGWVTYGASMVILTGLS